jgi:hypothetical protein
MLKTMARLLASELPADLRPRLEHARLDLLALFRALDHIDLSAREIPQRLIRQLFELDADFAEALWALDQPSGSLDSRAVLRDTSASLQQLVPACSRFRKTLPARSHSSLPALEMSIRGQLTQDDAYSMVPGRDPQNR